MTDTTPTPRTIIIGGGLAGMAAALALESAGHAVTLLESRRSLGGRAGSFEDPASGETLDNCQHVLLGCCTNLQDFYRRLGVEDLIRFDKTITFLDAAGHAYSLAGTPGLPAPLHLGPAMLRFSLLTWPERISAARTMLAMMTLSPAARAKLDDVSFGQWLDDHHQSPSLIAKLYDPVLIGALNEETRRASAAHAIHVFQDSLLSNSAGYTIGVPTVPLSRLYERLPCQDTRLGTRVAELLFNEDSSQVTGIRLTTGENLPADNIILATGYHAALRWLPPAAQSRDSRFAFLDRLESTPILGIHLRFDRPVFSLPHAAFVEGPLQWIFRKDETGRALHGVVSAARPWLDIPKDQATQLFLDQLRRTLPAARDAKLEHSVIVIEKRATFAPLPGVNRYRPPQAPPPNGISNLYLAGDYTQSGWPATMEGAVRSGYLAAEALSRKLNRPRHFLVPDLQSQWPAQIMATLMNRN